MSAGERTAPDLHVVEETPRTEAEQILDAIVPTLLVAEKTAERLKGMMARAGRDLASERGVAFIREEQIRAEFGTAAENEQDR